MQPEQLGPFRIKRVLGRGGMGAVYEGIHIDTGETAAVKALLSALEDDDELRLRFEAEIDTLKRLRHPNIVRLYGFGEEQGMLYYVMEMVDGPSLHQEMKRRRVFDWSEAAKIGLEMCSALKHAHDRGITHRDIKPANILLEQQGTSKLSDYGIARLFGGGHLTNVNSVVGTLEYMSPEQALAHPVGPRSDLYSLGAVLYAILTGRPPHSAKSLGEVLRKHQNNTPDPIRSTRFDVPDELEAIILDLLKTKQEERPGNAYMVGKQLQSLLQALLGPPEKVLVRPMSDDTMRAPTILPVPLPSDPLQERIGRARGIVTDGGIIDLGGIVRNAQDAGVIEETRVSGTPVETNADELLKQSFGHLGEDVPHSSGDGMPFDPLCHREGEEHAEFLHEEYRRRGIPAPEDIVHREAPFASIDKIDQPKSSNEGTGEFLATAKGAHSTPPSPPIRHGEIILETSTGIRRSKDDPLPDLEIFEALQRDRPVGDSPLELAADAARDNATKWTGRQLPPPPPDTQQPAADLTGKALSPFLQGPPEPLAAKTDVAKVTVSHGMSRSQTGGVEKSGLGATRFTSVSEEDLGGFKRTPDREAPYFSFQTILTSMCLVLTGLLIYYLLQPVPAEELFSRIKGTVQADDSGEFSVSSLRQAEREIKSFLSMYSQHPKADIVRGYEEELELATKEQKLLRRQTFSKPSALAPAEWVYLEAISFSRTDPEKERLKLRAIVDLFDTDVPRKRDDQSVNRRLSNETELCVELARRRLKKLEAELATIQKNLMEQLETRLDAADRLQDVKPTRAKEIRLSLIELYGDRPWAAPLVERAKSAHGHPADEN